MGGGRSSVSRGDRPGRRHLPKGRPKTPKSRDGCGESAARARSRARSSCRGQKRRSPLWRARSREREMSVSRGAPSVARVCAGKSSTPLKAGSVRRACHAAGGIRGFRAVGQPPPPRGAGAGTRRSRGRRLRRAKSGAAEGGGPSAARDASEVVDLYRRVQPQLPSRTLRSAAPVTPSPSRSVEPVPPQLLSMMLRSAASTTPSPLKSPAVA